MDYKLKYYKYKQKYLNLQNLLPIGPSPELPTSDFINTDENKLEMIKAGRLNDIPEEYRYFSNSYNLSEIYLLWRSYPNIISNIKFPFINATCDFIDPKNLFNKYFIHNQDILVQMNTLIDLLYKNIKKMKIQIKLPCEVEYKAWYAPIRDAGSFGGSIDYKKYYLDDFLEQAPNLEELEYSSYIVELNKAIDKFFNNNIKKLRRLCITVTNYPDSYKNISDTTFPNLEILELSGSIGNDTIYKLLNKGKFPKLRELRFGNSFTLSKEELIKLLNKLSTLTRLSLSSKYPEITSLTSPRPSLIIERY